MKRSDLITEYAEIKSEIDRLNERKEQIREELASILHNENVNEMIMTDNHGKKWQVKYQSSKRKSVDYNLLLEEVGQDKFNEIVSTSEVVSFVVKNAPKEKKKDSMTKVAPKEEEKDATKDIPKGKIE